MFRLKKHLAPRYLTQLSFVIYFLLSLSPQLHDLTLHQRVPVQRIWFFPGKAWVIYFHEIIKHESEGELLILPKQKQVDVSQRDLVLGYPQLGSLFKCSGAQVR